MAAPELGVVMILRAAMGIVWRERDLSLWASFIAENR